MLKIIWSPAITLDGYIARTNGDSDWVSDEDGKLFHKLIKNTGCVIVGRKTYEQYKGQAFPVKGATTFVWTRHPETAQKEATVEYISGEPSNVAKQIEEKGFSQAVLAGGGITNNAFVALGFVTEVVVTIYPMTFGIGIKMLSEECNLSLELLDSQDIGGGVIRQRYRVK